MRAHVIAVLAATWLHAEASTCTAQNQGTQIATCQPDRWLRLLALSQSALPQGATSDQAKFDRAKLDRAICARRHRLKRSRTPEALAAIERAPDLREIVRLVAKAAAACQAQHPDKAARLRRFRHELHHQATRNPAREQRLQNRELRHRISLLAEAAAIIRDSGGSARAVQDLRLGKHAVQLQLANRTDRDAMVVLTKAKALHRGRLSALVNQAASTLVLCDIDNLDYLKRSTELMKLARRLSSEPGGPFGRGQRTVSARLPIGDRKEPTT